MRLAARLSLLATLLLALLPLHGLWRLFRLPSPWPRRFLAASARIMGARARVVGTPLTRDTVILANHLSWMDILLLAGSTGATFVATDDLRRAPLVGWLASLNATIFVARGNRMGVGDQVAAVRAALGPRPVAIFPEGTTGDGARLLPFKPALLAALDPPVPGLQVQPVRIDYGAATGELAWVGAERGIDHARRVLRRRGSFVATLRFAEPFHPAGDRKVIAAEARRRIEALVVQPNV
ncbi:lysophospholipid acyltransferase family protein [Sphingomonas sp. KR1UV-12]|uniref:Lysophospholipid acyltransferase family protein n=1 Tax=Sphingomonas aurea TaxID=3063994 RepID=A0ABT9EMQ5_9SPHN|nr:lysophospholipid acyltransferase family protein [Sphingomonas sp. KR1UV-12]MDP1028240.1 lysophospholipid acyltransferase family protein [Sphingomonas sp. KR1UV-12]